MKTYHIYSIIPYITIMICLSCNNNKNSKIIRESGSPIIVSENIESSMPGELLITDQYILWCDPFNSDINTHILNKTDGKELAQTVKKGNGPYELNMPFTSIYSYSDNSILAYDFNRKKQIVYSIDNCINKQDEILFEQNEDIQHTTRIIPSRDQSLIYFSPMSETPFTLKRTDSIQTFGHLPFYEKISNAYSIYQGEIAYHPQKEILVYSTFSFPYLAIYQWNQQNFTLTKEIGTLKDYTIHNEELHLDSQQKGIFELSLTKKYIVTLERDYKYDKTNENEVGRDFNKLPHTIFLYNYNLELEKIIDLGMPILRIASNCEENTVYIIGLKDDFILAKYEI